MLDAAAMKKLRTKISRIRHEGVAPLQANPVLSERRACNIFGADRKMMRYQSKRPPEAELRQRLPDLANERGRFRYRRQFVLLRHDREPSGIKRIYRLYREEGLTVRKRRARRKAVGARAPMLVERGQMLGAFWISCMISSLAGGGSAL